MSEPLVPPRERSSAARSAVFQAARRALMGGGAGGIWLSGEAGSGKTTLLDDLLTELPATCIVLRHDAGALGPKDLAEDLNAAVRMLADQPDRSRVVLAIDDADRLRRDTLDVLDGMAGWLFGHDRRVQLVMASRPSLGARLTVNHQDQLAACLASRLLLPSPAGDDAVARPHHGLTGMAFPAEARDEALAAAQGRPAQVGVQLQQVLHRLTGHKRRLARRIAITAVPGALVLAATAAGIWYVAAPSPTPGAREAAWTAPAPLALPVLPSLASAVIPAGVALAGPADLMPPVVPVSPPPASPDVAAPAAPPPSIHLLADASLVQPEQPVLLAALRPAAADVPPPNLVLMEIGPATPPRSAPGLLLVAQPGDTLAVLYQQVYRGTVPPAFGDVQAINPGPVRPGRRMLFPSPPQGWASH